MFFSTLIIISFLVYMATIYYKDLIATLSNICVDSYVILCVLRNTFGMSEKIGDFYRASRPLENEQRPALIIFIVAPCIL